MSRYTVVWVSQLESEFLEQWTDGDSSLRSVLTHAADWLDVELRDSPEAVGTVAGASDDRVVLIPDTDPYIVEAIFTIIPEDRQVRVTSISFRQDTD